MTLEQYIADKPITYIILDFGNTLLQGYSTTKGYEANTALKQFVLNNATQYIFYIWSHSPHEQILSCLKQWHMASVITGIISLDNMIEAKPSPASFALLANPAEINKNEWLLVGDSYSDEQAAAALGIIFYKWV